MAMKWDKETIMLCLNMYASYPCLWDPHSCDYKSKEKRACAMEEILRGLNINGFSLEMLKTKIHSIRNTYTNEKRKIEKSKRDSNAHIYIPKIAWFAFADSFLGKASHSRRNRLRMDSEEISYDVTYATSFKQELHFEDSNPSTPPAMENQISEVPTVIKENTDFHPLGFDKIEPPQKMSFSLPEDELDVFGRSMVAQMRKLPEEYAVEIMSEIQSLLANKRLKFIADKKQAAGFGAECKFYCH